MHFQWSGSWVWRSLCAQKMLAFDSGVSSEPHHSVASQSLALPVCKVESPQAPHSFGRGGDVDRLGCSDARHTGSWCMLGEQSPQLLFGLPLAGRGHCSEQGFLLGCLWAQRLDCLRMGLLFRKPSRNGLSQEPGAFKPGPAFLALVLILGKGFFCLFIFHHS